MQQSLDSRRGDEASSSRSRNHSDVDGTALAGLFGGERVRFTKVGAPVPSSNREDGEFGNDDGGTDSSCDFLGGLDTETDVAFAVANDHNSLESSSLTGTGLLLDGFDLEQTPLDP